MSTIGAAGRGGRSIATRVMALVLFGLAAMVAGMGALGWFVYRPVQEEVAAQRRHVAELLARQIADRVARIQWDLQGLSRGPGIDLSAEARPALRVAIREAYLRSPYVDEVFLIDRDGEIVWAEPDQEAPSDEARRAALDALRTGRPGITNLLDRTARSPGRAHVLVPLRDWQGTLVATAAATLAPGTLRFNAFAEEIHRTGALLVDGRGHIVAGPAGAREVATTFSSDDDEKRAVRAIVPASAWHVHVPTESPEGPGSDGLMGSLAFAAVALFAGALLFAWGAGQSVKRPLGLLTASAERLASGDLSQPLPIVGNDEIGRLGRALERMRQELKTSLDRIAAANRALEERVAARTRDLEAANEQLRLRDQARVRLLRQVISAQEAERKRVARELHDETSQTLAALSVRLQTALAALPPGPGRDQVEQADALAGRGLDELRRLMHDLRPSVLDDLGLSAAIRWSADRLAERGVTVSCELDIPASLPYEVETALFRAVQEVLSNVARHARAEHVLIQSDVRDGELRIEIEDDGVGFDVGSVTVTTGEARGLGLAGLRERMELVSGRAVIDSAPGRGTRVLLAVPYAEDHVENQSAPRG